MRSTTVIPVGHVDVQLLNEGDAIVRMTLNGKAWEPETRGAWAQMVEQCSPNDIVMDVGAYTGIYAIASALMGMKVIALEPHPINFARVKANAALNSVRIETLPIAVSDRTGTCTLHMKQRINDTASLEPDGDVLCVEQVEVLGARIDHMLLSRRIGLLKIDVEHHESAVLVGGLYTIQSHRPLIVVETLSECAHLAVSLMLGKAGYKHRCVLDGRNSVYEPSVG